SRCLAGSLKGLEYTVVVVVVVVVIETISPPRGERLAACCVADCDVLLMPTLALSRAYTDESDCGFFDMSSCSCGIGPLALMTRFTLFDDDPPPVDAPDPDEPPLDCDGDAAVLDGDG